jgi:hypothetical protein
MKGYLDRRGVGRGLPASKLPKGKYLVHNRVDPYGEGFRAWVQSEKPDYRTIKRCRCDFQGRKHANLNPHYRAR